MENNNTLLELITDGLRQATAAYIEHPEFELDEYRTITLSYLLETLMFQLDPDQQAAIVRAVAEVVDGNADLRLAANYPNSAHFGVLAIDGGVVAFSPRGVERYDSWADVPKGK